MATGFKSNGVDLDALLAAGSSSYVTGFKSSGVDLGTLFAAYSSGGQLTTGFLWNGQDLGKFFQAIVPPPPAPGPAPAPSPAPPPAPPPAPVATAAPSDVFGAAPLVGADAVSEAATCSVTGGSGSYSYGWSQVSGSPGIVTDSPMAATTSWRKVRPIRGSEYNAIYQCNITDTVTGQTAISNPVSVTLDGPPLPS